MIKDKRRRYAAIRAVSGHRADTVNGYRMRLLKALVAEDLHLIFSDLGWGYPYGDVVQARYDLLNGWNDQIRDLVLDLIAHNLNDEESTS